ncbi:hypothetical protein [Pseudomonas sp. 35 E 8]|nr:hypothetical protein [Pseudomonas sp. 35 E 8]
MGVGTAADVGVATVHDTVIDTVLGLHVHGATGLDHGGVALVGRHQLGGFAQGGLFVLHLADERSQAGFDTVHVLARRIALGEGGRFAVPTTRLALTFGGKDPVVLGVVSHKADVAQLIDAHGHGAAGGNATAAVEQVAAAQQHVAAGGDAGTCGRVADDKVITHGDLERSVLLAAVAVATGHAKDTGSGCDRSAVDARLGGQHGTDVIDRAGGQDQVALAFDRPRTVDDAGGRRALPVAIDAQVAHGVNRGAEVFQAVGAQVHVAAAEDQTVVIEQVVYGQVEVALAGDGAADGPVQAFAGQAASAEQLAGGGLVQVVDVDGQAPGLDRRAVGPIGFVEGQVAVGDQAAAHVIQADAAQVEHAGAHVQHLAAGVLEGVCSEAQLVVGGFQAAAVIQQAADGVAGFTCVAQGAHLAAVVQAGARDIEGRGAFDQAAVGQDTAQVDVDPVAGDLAAVVDIDPGKTHTAAGEQCAVAVIEVDRVNHCVTGFGGDAPTVVIEGTGGDVQAALLAVDQAVGAVLQQARRGDCHPAVGGEGAFVLVIDAVGEQRQQALAGELAALVVDVGSALHQQRPDTRQLAVAVDQVAEQIQGDRTATGEVAGAVVEAVAMQGKRARAVDDAALAVVQQAIDVEGLCAVAEQLALVAVVDAIGGDVQRLPGAHRTALVIQVLRGSGGEGAIGDHRASVADVLAVERDVANGIAGVVGVDPGFNDAGVGQLAVTGQGDAVASGESLAVFQRALGLRLEAGARIDRALGLQARGLDIHRAAGGRLGHAQVAVGVELNIAATGGQRTVELHANAGFSAHQLDGAGVHAAQGRGVNRQFRFRAAVIGAHGGFQALRVDIVAPGNHGELACVDLCIDLGGAGDDLETVDVAGVQALAVDGHRTSIDLVVIQAADFIDDGFAGGQGDVGRVDKPAAVAADTVGVGHDDLGRLARHFGVATQLAGAATVDFVEDDVRRATLEVGVADDDPAQLGALHRARGIVENHAIGADVIVLELVMGQAAAIGCGDVHHRHAIPCLANRSARAADRNAVGLGQQRLPEQRVGQDQCQAALGQAFQGGSRASVHIQNLKAAVLITGKNPGGNRSALRARSPRQVAQGNGQRSRWC